MARKKRSVAAGSRRRREQWLNQKRSNIEQLRVRPQDVPLRCLYDLPMILIDSESVPTTKTRRQADRLFTEKIMQATAFKSSMIDAKRQHWQQVLHAAKKAMHTDSTVGVVHRTSHADFSRIRQQVIDCAIETGLLWEHRSKPGSPKLSRAVPTYKLRKYAEVDPWAFEPDRRTLFVEFYKRDGKKTPIPFDLRAMHPGHIANETQQRLELINRVNSMYRINYRQYSSEDKKFIGSQQLRPVHVAKFIEHWDWYGRLHTDSYGHQSLLKLERQTITFNGCPSIEKDYGGMHTRVFYHIRTRIDYQDDPYKLWGEKTTKDQRLLAKILINAALNAETRIAAISACNSAMNSHTQEPMKNRKGQIIRGHNGHILYERKTGDSLQDALQLYDAYKKTGLTFSQIYDLALKVHAPIAQYFGTDAGIWLMRIDSSIAIDVMYAFAKEAVPCLCCHDSFIVPAQHEQQLIELMTKWYFLRFGKLPIIK